MTKTLFIQNYNVNDNIKRPQTSIYYLYREKYA